MSRSPRMGNQQATKSCVVSNCSGRNNISRDDSIIKTCARDSISNKQTDHPFTLTKRPHISSVTVRGPSQDEIITTSSCASSPATTTLTCASSSLCISSSSPPSSYLPDQIIRLPRVKTTHQPPHNNFTTQSIATIAIGRESTKLIDCQPLLSSSSSPCNQCSSYSTDSVICSSTDKHTSLSTCRVQSSTLHHHSPDAIDSSVCPRRNSVNPLSSYFTDTNDVIASSASAIESLDSVDVSLCSSCNCNCNPNEEEGEEYCHTSDDQITSCPSSDTFTSHSRIMKKSTSSSPPSTRQHCERVNNCSPHQQGTNNTFDRVNRMQMSQVNNLDARRLSETNSSSKQFDSQVHLTDSLTEREIKFTHIPGCTLSTFLCVLCAIVFIVVGTSSGIYYGLNSFHGKNLRDRVFRSNFIITHGQSYTREFENASSDAFRETALKWQIYFNRLFTSSDLHKVYKNSEVIALEKAKEGTDDTIIYFNLHFIPVNYVSVAEIYVILADGLLKLSSTHLSDHLSEMKIDHSSLDLVERRDESKATFYFPFTFYPFRSIRENETVETSHNVNSRVNTHATFNTPTSVGNRFNRLNPWHSTRVVSPGILEGFTTQSTIQLVKRTCQVIEITYCSNVVSYNLTSYPNIVGHDNSTSVKQSLDEFRQIVDAECYSLAREFICHLLQPNCHLGQIIYPCREDCVDFKNSCGRWIDRAENTMNQLISQINCQTFPTFNGTISTTSLQVKHFNVTLSENITSVTEKQVQCSSLTKSNSRQTLSPA